MKLAILIASAIGSVAYISMFLHKKHQLFYLILCNVYTYVLPSAHHQLPGLRNLHSESQGRTNPLSSDRLPVRTVLPGAAYRHLRAAVALHQPLQEGVHGGRDLPIVDHPPIDALCRSHGAVRSPVPPKPGLASIHVYTGPLEHPAVHFQRLLPQ